MKKIKSLIAIILTFVMILSLTGCGETKKAETAVNNASVPVVVLCEAYGRSSSPVPRRIITP